MKQKKRMIPEKSTTARDHKNSLAPEKQIPLKINRTENNVAEKAYFMYLEQGSPEGLDMHHWLLAEAEVKAYQIDRIAAVSTVIAKALTARKEENAVSSNGAADARNMR
jgi:hypothetical protein